RSIGERAVEGADHLTGVLGRDEAGIEELEIVFRDPTGPAAQASNVYGDPVLERELDQLLERRQPDGRYGVRDGRPGEDRAVSGENDLRLVPGLHESLGHEPRQAGPCWVLRAVRAVNEDACHAYHLPSRTAILAPSSPFRAWALRPDAARKAAAKRPKAQATAR